MLKRTLHFGSPVHLSARHKQLVVDFKESIREQTKIPIEDIGIVILENPQITITQYLLEALLEEKVAVITCNSKHMPNGLMLPLEGNTEQTARIKTQINATIPLKKQLWQHTIKQKIANQAAVLSLLGLENQRLLKLRTDVLSDDTTNCEGQAASHYWGKLYGNDFIRSRDAGSPNAQLNYGYAILRAIVARALVASGMLPTIGIHHKNKYNAYCLADDIMEPYRPYVDLMVLGLPGIKDEPLEDEEGLTQAQKVQLLTLPQVDVIINNLKRPLYHAVSMTTASLYKCFAGEKRKIIYPEL